MDSKKYQPIYDYIKNKDDDEIKLSINEIEKIISDKLPPSKMDRQLSNRHKAEFLKAGYTVHISDIEWIFKKVISEVSIVSKYKPLGQYLANKGQDYVDLTFSEIENILGFKLPDYLYKHEAGWYGTAEGSPTHRQKAVWCSYGYQVDTVNIISHNVVFKKL